MSSWNHFFWPAKDADGSRALFPFAIERPLCAKAVGGISCRRPQRADSGRPSFRSATPRSGGHASFASARLRSERIKNILLVDSARAVLHYREGAGWYAWVSSGRLRTLRELGSSQARMTRTEARPAAKMIFNLSEPDHPYLLVQRRFEDEDGDVCYIETHDTIPTLAISGCG